MSKALLNQVIYVFDHTKLVDIVSGFFWGCLKSLCTNDAIFVSVCTRRDLNFIGSSIHCFKKLALCSSETRLMATHTHMSTKQRTALLLQITLCGNVHHIPPAHVSVRRCLHSSLFLLAALLSFWMYLLTMCDGSNIYTVTLAYLYWPLKTETERVTENGELMSKE